MAKRTGMTFEDFSAMALALPGVEARTTFGTPGFFVKKKFLARLREEDVLVLTPVEDDEQQFLMETQPRAFFLTDHYRGHPTILIRLSKADRGQVQELLEQAWRRKAPKRLLEEARAVNGGQAPPPDPAPARRTAKGQKR
jgi:hypothetical protein